jgi:glutamate racemase
MIKRYIKENLLLYKGKIDKVFLGCTHYYYIKDELNKALECEIIDGRKSLIEKMEREIYRKTKKTPTDFCYL